MPIFEIEQYELHTTTYHVEADNIAEAIVKLLDGDGDPVDNSTEYIEVADDKGLWAEDHPELAQRLRDQGVPVDHVIPSIRNVTQQDQLSSTE